MTSETMSHETKTYETILTETRDRVGVIRLNRPEKLNAWTSQMSADLVDQIQRWNDDEGIGAIVLTGEGRAFCAGADMGGFNERRQSDGGVPEDPWAYPQATQFASSWTELLQRSKPTVAAVNGYAIGVGLTMVLPCDVRIAAEGARLSIRFVKVGLVPELASTRLLPQLVGLGHATDMCLTGRFVEAGEALHMGLVTQVTPPEQLLDTAMAKADELANNPTRVVMLIKQLLAANPLEPDLRAVSEREQVRDRIARRWPDHAEAVTGFVEKREPRFNAPPGAGG